MNPKCWVVGIVAALCSACTCMTVSRVAPNSATVGVRYALPRPFIRMTPQADGSVVADVVYLPDWSNTYAIDASSYLATHTLDVELTDEGFLKSVEWNPNTAAVAGQAVSSAGGVATSILTAQSTAATAAKGKVSDAQKDVDAAQTQVDVDKATIAELTKEHAPQDAVSAAQLALAQDEVKLAAAQAALKRAIAN